LAKAATTGNGFALVERLLDAPADCRPAPPLQPGYRLEVEGARVRVRFGVGADESGDACVDVDYQTGVGLCRFTSGPELEALSAAAAAKGLIRISGDLSGSPIDLSALHDAVVPFTR
jgi:hypothetical protein